MGYRDLISRSILDAIFRRTAPKTTVLGRILAFFALFQIVLARFHPETFERLRTHVWMMDEAEYTASFRRERKKGALTSIGDLGYSGSTFFTTSNSKFLAKSLPRRFEYTFFEEDLFEPYVAHMTAHPSSLLVRITDFLYAPQTTIGVVLGTSPSHHVVMENILYGQSSDSDADKWETYDLKPVDYFYPERDLAGGNLATQSTKDRLIDTFEDKIQITTEQKGELLDLLESDTALLESCNAVDYSLFIVRYPSPVGTDRIVPSLESKAGKWRSGMTSADQKWVYRAVILDFFWAKHKFQPRAMTGLVKTFDLLARKGPMSITTTPDEYRRRFLSMVQGLLAVQDP